jgi:hypothetical protein
MSTHEVDSDGNKYWYNEHGQYHRIDGPAIERRDGIKEWWLNGDRHREDGPAVEMSNGHREWWLNGERHRIDGLTIEYSNGDRYWYINGKLHREDGPAYEGIDGTKCWYTSNKLHRIDGPAVERGDEHKEWWLEGKRHRIDGPAIEYRDGNRSWWVDNIVCSEKKFNEMVRFPDLAIPYVVEKNNIYFIKFREDVGIRISYFAEAYIDGEFIRLGDHVKELLLQFARGLEIFEPLLDWIEENDSYFPSEFIEKLYY